MIQTNWYVITGAPSSGKTTLINQLALQGHTIAPEVARDYIEGLLANNHTLEMIQQNNRQLQRGILAIALKRERRLQTHAPIFFDRGTADSLGYFDYYQLEAQHMKQACQHLRYKKIFYCHQLPLIQDEIRVEDNETAKRIGELIYQAYTNLGYQLIELPPVPVEERIQMILPHIEC
ncbi:ATPase [Legionella sp. km772]|nr:ATPase [Legionella sp. km772]